MLRKKHREILARIFSSSADLKSVFDKMGLGVTITDRDGDIIYYNQCQADIDELDPRYVLGRHQLTVYEATTLEPSVTMTVHETRTPVTNVARIYNTLKGKRINSTHSVYPLFDGGEFLGSLCFIQIYNQGQAESIVRERRAETGGGFDRVVSQNPRVLKAIDEARAAASGPAPMLLHGPTGSGKELFAKGIHEESPWRKGRYVSVNCAAIPGNLLEGVLFGTAKGAFTGAVDQPGLFEEAEGGVFFLDELDSMPPALQPKLLRVLEDKRVRRLGGVREKAVNFKLVASVSGSPTELVRRRRLRADLFYRVGVVVLSLPPLKERPEDLELLVNHFLDRLGRQFGKRLTGLAPATWELFRRHHWPGNVRELEHLLEGAMNLAGSTGQLGPELLPEYFHFDLNRGRQPAAPNPYQPKPIGWSPEEAGRREREALIQALTAAAGNISLAAAMLNLNRQTLGYRMKKHGLAREDFRPNH